jgi:hypothetical protein
MTRLQREYWRRNIELQRRAISVNEAYARKMYELQNTMRRLSEHVEDVNGRMNLFSGRTMAELADRLTKIDPLFRSFITNVEQLAQTMDASGEGLPDYRAPTSDTPEYSDYQSGIDFTYPGQLRQYGGRVHPGEKYLVGESGIEEFKPDVTGSIIPLNDPWGTTIISTPSAASDGRSINLSIYIGDEHITDMVIDAVDSSIEV